MNEFFFCAWPYICLSIFTLGLLARYIATPGEWNSRSSNLFAKKSLMTGSYLFHYAIILTFFGHMIGLLIPQALLTQLGFNLQVHTVVAQVAGDILAPCVFIGLAILLARHFFSREVWATTLPMDLVVILLIMWLACTGGYQDYMGHYDAFDTVAPWVRGILTLQPRPELMADVPAYLKVHACVGFFILACIPFSRLVHFISFPFTWFLRPIVSYRRRYENL